MNEFLPTDKALLLAGLERKILKDTEGIVYGYPSTIEVDMVIKEGVHILIEVKSRVSRSDIAELYRIGLLYERIYGIKPKLVIVGGFVDHNVWELATKLNIEIKSVIEE